MGVDTNNVTIINQSQYFDNKLEIFVYQGISLWCVILFYLNPTWAKKSGNIKKNQAKYEILSIANLI